MDRILFAFEFRLKRCNYHTGATARTDTVPHGTNFRSVWTRQTQHPWEPLYSFVRSRLVTSFVRLLSSRFVCVWLLGLFICSVVKSPDICSIFRGPLKLEVIFRRTGAEMGPSLHWIKGLEINWCKKLASSCTKPARQIIWNEELLYSSVIATPPLGELM